MNEESQINELAKAIERAYQFDKYSLCRYIATMLYRDGYREKKRAYRRNRQRATRFP